MDARTDEGIAIRNRKGIRLQDLEVKSERIQCRLSRSGASYSWRNNIPPTLLLSSEY